jgi:hypothetical protein
VEAAFGTLWKEALHNCYWRYYGLTTNTMYRVFLEQLIAIDLVNKFPVFTKAEGSVLELIPSSQRQICQLKASNVI